MHLNVFPIVISLLRERVSDIPALLDFFLEKKSRQLKLPAIPRLAEDTIKRLMDYSWPGSVRELENILERALILNPSGLIRFDHLSQENSPEPGCVQKNQQQGLPDFQNLARDYLQKVLKQSAGRINGLGGTAELTGLNPSTLRHKLKKLGLDYHQKQPSNH